MTELYKPKESLVKMLLSTPISHSVFTSTTTVPSTSTITTPNTQNSPSETDEGGTKLITYFQTSTGEKETDLILMDHSYCRPWNWRPETSFIRPTKCLFVWKSGQRSATGQPLHSNSSNIDIVNVMPTPTPIYDVEKAKNLMEECERHAAFARVDSGNDDWEDTISKVNWTTSQNNLFTKMAKILNSDRLARLTYSGTWNEPIVRRTIIDKSVQRTRNLMASISWDVRLTQWLHNVLIDNLTTPYLGAYFDILQTLKAKLPTFVEKMIFGPSAATRVGATSNESLFPLLKRAWDPVASSLIQDKPKKLPGNPVFIIAPTSPSIGPSFSKRLHKWTNMLTSLAHVITVNANVAGRTTNMTTCADTMLGSLRSKIQEVRTDCPSRPIVLVGFNTGAALCCQVAEMEHVLCVVCMGFPLLTAEGKRGEPDDILLDMQCPVLFVVGQNSHRTSREDMEDLRERMRVETGLVVVGSADDYLRMCKSKKRSEGITQSIVDRCILDEIGEFVGSVLLSPYPSRQMYAPGAYSNDKRIKIERIRSNSNCSSLESEPPSPQPLKITRPVGRPPGSGKKKKYFHHCPCPIPCLPYARQEVRNELYQVANSLQQTSSAATTIPPMTVISSRSFQGNTLSNLLQKDSTASTSMRTISTSTGNSTIKVLDNIQTSTGMKVLSTGGRTVDLSKVTLVNSVAKSTGLSNIVVLADGTKCIRNTNNPNVLQSVKSISPNQPMVVPLVQNRQIQIQKSMPHSPGITKLVSTRRQITTAKPRPVANLAPPTNLTTADILDLPIIFADNDSNLLQQNIEEPIVRKQNSKYVVINKQSLVPTSQQNILKRPANTVRQGGQKYARIIINQNQLQEADDKRQVLISSQKKSDEIVTISPKKIDTCSSLEFVDLETELKTNTVPKPMHATILGAQKVKPEIKFTGRNIIRVPIGQSSRMQDPGEVFVLNRSLRKTGKSPEYKTYKLENVYDEDFEEGDVEK